jgi:hypothetical protein
MSYLKQSHQFFRKCVKKAFEHLKVISTHEMKKLMVPCLMPMLTPVRVMVM